MGASATLIRFAKSREVAYMQHKCLTTTKAKAITHIKQVADYFSQQSEMVQLQAVIQTEHDLYAILPAEHSRYKKLRCTILDLISQAKSLPNEQFNQPHRSNTTHGSGNIHPKRNPPTQLSMFR